MYATFRTTILATTVLLAAAMTAGAETRNPQAEFQRGHFLQTHQNDPAAAAVAFEKFLASAGQSEPLRAEAEKRLAQCREDVASSDLARLMPPETVVYAEISQPGKHIDRLIRMMGLVGDPNAKSPQTKAKAIPLGDGFFFPEDFAVSPALVAELSAPFHKFL